MSESDVMPDSSAASLPPVIEPSTADAPPVVESHAPPIQPPIEGAIEAPIEAAVAETAGQKEFRHAVTWARAKIYATILAMRNSLGRTVSHLTIYLCLLTFLTLWARSHWTLELLTHFRAYFALALAAGCVLCLLLWRWRTALFASLFLIWHVTLIAPFYMDSPATELPLGASHGDELRGITVNVLCRNKNKEAVLSYIREQDPDQVDQNGEYRFGTDTDADGRVDRFRRPRLHGDRYPSFAAYGPVQVENAKRTAGRCGRRHFENGQPCHSDGRLEHDQLVALFPRPVEECEPARYAARVRLTRNLGSPPADSAAAAHRPRAGDRRRLHPRPPRWSGHRQRSSPRRV